MSRLSYGSFEEILRPYIKPKIIKLDLANILFLAPVDQESREANKVNSTTVTRVCTGERPLPPVLLDYYTKPDALKRTVAVFSADVVNRIQEVDKAALTREILTLIQNDEAMPQETKAAFEALARDENLCIFLAKAYLYAVTRKDAPGKMTNLPRQNQFFCGREDLLAAISSRYEEGVHVQGLYGMGGVGKTQLALQYAHTHFDEYDTVWWINAENKAVLQDSVSKFLSALKRLPKGRNAENVQTAFLGYLNRHSGWLLIYDNAEYGTDEEYETLLSYFPGSPKGHILLTTRCADAFEGSAHMEVSVFGSGEAVDFLRCRSHLEGRLSAEKVSAQLGHLPLALEYAAAYIRETPGVDYAAYSKRLERYGIRVLDRPVGRREYKNTVRQAFHITLDRILEDAETNPVSRSVKQFLSLCSFLAPDGIEIDVLSKYGSALPEPVRTVLTDDLDRDELLRSLTRYSLVHVEESAMSMHRLLQEVLRDELAPDDRILFINYAYGVFYGIFYSLREISLDLARPLLLSSVPHIQSILSRYVQLRRQEGQELPDSVMVAKEYFSWSALLLSDAKQLNGDELTAAYRRNASVLQTAAEFYDAIPGAKTIYPAYTQMLQAQAHEKLGEETAVVSEYMEALSVLREVISGSLTNPAHLQPGTVQLLYQDEAFQLASDICAAVGSSAFLYRHAELLWENFKSLVQIVQAKMLCFPQKEDAGRYMEAALFLKIFCSQVADCTQRAFILRLCAPENWREARDRSLRDGPFGFFFPSIGMEAEPPERALAGFDILLGRDDGELTKKMNSPWTTLAFPEDVCSENEMLNALTAINAEGLSGAARRTLYSTICVLAGHLRQEDIMQQYTDRLREVPSLE